LKKILIIPDVHRPYHDKRAWSLLLRVGMAFKPDKIVTLGDFADFYCVSSHDKDPNRVNGLEAEVADVNVALDELDQLKAKEKIFITGNHENRLERYLMTKAPELFNMMGIKELFQLKKRNWKYVPYKNHIKIGKLHITHDTGKAGKYAHYQSMDDFQDNTVIGHTHRLGYTVVGNAKGVPHVGAMFGWLGDVEQVEYMHRIKALRDWALGFGIGYEEPNGNMHLQPVPMVDYKVVVEGKLYKA
jgi:predicted phosphodiesterase